MPPLTYNRVIPPSLVDRFTAQHRDHIATLEAKVALLEEQVRVQAATIHVLHPCSVCDVDAGPYPHTDPATGEDRCEAHCPVCHPGDEAS